MNLRSLIIIILVAGLMGCASAEIAKLEDETKTLRSQVTELNDKIDELDEKTNDLSRNVDDFNAQLSSLSVRISDLNSQTDVITEKVDRINTTVHQINNIKTQSDISIGVDKRLKDLENKITTEKEITKIKVKVLSGDGNLASAKKMSGVLKGFGYNINKVGYAKRDNFLVNTVFFASGYEEEADKIAKQLGGKSISLPLTWTSTFDIIVVTGKHS
jgi:outer membrane murein-binding lipoprotein Lpp